MLAYFKKGLGQWISALIICLCPLSVGLSFSWSTPALPQIIDGSAGFTMSENYQAIMLALLYVGNLTSPLLCGWCMNQIGRRLTCFTCNLFAITGWLIIIFSTDAILLCVARFLIGFWNGSVFTVCPPYLAEMVHTSIRGTAGVMLGQSVFLGGLYASLAGTLKDYKLLNILCVIPSILLFFGIFLMPESPYYSLMKGRKEKAKSDIMWLQGEITDEKLEAMNTAVKMQMENRGRIWDLFAPGTRIALGMATVLVVVQRGAGMSIIFTYSSLIIPDSWVSSGSSFMIICGAWIVSSVCTSFIINKFGRRHIFIVSCVGVSIAAILLSTWYFLRDNAQLDMSNTQWLPLLLFVVNALFFGLGLGSVPTIVAAEVFPVNVKGLGSAVYTIIGSIASGIVVRLFYPLKNNFGLYSNFIIFAGVSLLGVLFALILMIETRGKTMEQIQEILAEFDPKKSPSKEEKSSKKYEPTVERFAYTNEAFGLL